nr:hypothetical protein [Flavobacterium sp.]
MISELLGDSQYYEEESYFDMIGRYKGFGENFYSLLKEKLPLIFTHLKFYKATETTLIYVLGEAQTSDSYAIFANDNNSFGIQLEPETPVICIWNWENHFEIGDWSENPDVEALNCLMEHFLKE